MFLIDDMFFVTIYNIRKLKVEIEGTSLFIKCSFLIFLKKDWCCFLEKKSQWSVAD